MEDPAPAIPLEKLVAHREWVRRVARALVRDESLADDLEQEVWLEAIQAPPREGRSLGGWLAAAMRHNLLDRRRSESRRRVREEAVARPEAGKSAAEVVAEAELLKKVVAAVLDLEEPGRGTLLLRYFEDLPLKEVARRQGIPLETVRTRIRTALRLLRDRFDAERGGDRKAWCLVLLPLMGKPEAATGGTVAGVASGVLVMGMKMKVAVAGAAIVLAGLLWWSRPWQAAGPRAESGRPLAAQGGSPSSAPAPVPPGRVPETGPSPAVPAAAESGGTIKGWIGDEAGAPVAGALVIDASGGPGTRDGASATTDRAGRFALEGVAGGSLELEVTAPGYDLLRKIELSRKDGPVVLTLKAHHTLSGRVLDDATGNGLPDMAVDLGPTPALGRAEAQWHARTGLDGAFRFRDLPPGAFAVSAGPDPGNQTSDHQRASLAPVQADRTDVEIRLSQRPAISGSVVVQGEGPFRGRFIVSVQGWGLDGEPDGRSRTVVVPAGEGTFRVNGLEPGLYDLEVHLLAEDDKAPSEFGPSILRDVPAGTDGLGVRLVRGDPIQGTVVAPDGSPVLAGGFVEVYGGPGETRSIGGCPVGRDGSFVTPPLERSGTYDLIYGDSAGKWGGVLRGATPGATGVSIQVWKPMVISGTILDDAGRPVPAGVPVQALSTTYTRKLFGRWSQAETGADGTFVLEGLGDFRFRIWAGGAQFRGTPSDFAPSVLEGDFPGGTAGLVIRLHPGEILSGTVRNAAGYPVRGAYLRAFPEGQEERGLWESSAWTGEDGTYSIKGLPLGRVVLSVVSNGRVLDLGTAEVPSQGFDLRIPE